MFMYGFDPLYFLFIAPAAILAFWAQWRVQSAFAEASKIVPSSGTTGAEAAAVVLKHSGIDGVEIELADGFLSDHYDPRKKVLRLSSAVHDGRTLAALGVAAHEAGHALQDAAGYPLLRVRNGLVPLASIGSWLSMILLGIGLTIQYYAHGQSGGTLILLGIAFFSLTVIFQLINLPVEFDASRRANELLLKIGLIREDEAPAVKRVLSAAAMTYVAATLMAVMQLLYFVVLASGNRRRD
jgi:uncharacterized protein